MHVTLELSGLANWMVAANMDPYDPINYPRMSNHQKSYLMKLVWDTLVDFATSRVNTVHGISYTDDSTILLISVLGEVVPATRTIQANVQKLLSRVAARIRSNDPNHLIGSGGLLHISPYSGYNDPNPYWQGLFSDVNVDVCMIHVYQTPSKVLPNSTYPYTVPESEWTNLPKYSAFCKNIGKPFIVDEFGLQMDSYSPNTVKRYFEFAFDSVFNTVPAIPIVQVWNWRPGVSFDIFVGDDVEVVTIMRNNAARWTSDIIEGKVQVGGTDGAATRAGTVDIQIQLCDFEDSSVSYQAGTSLDSTMWSTGASSLKMPWSFGSTAYATKDILFSPATVGFTPQWNQLNTMDGKLSCDVYLSSASAKYLASAYTVQLKVKGASGRIYQQTVSTGYTNFIAAGRWNRVYMRLDYDDLASEVGASITESQWNSELSNIQAFGLSLVHQSGTVALSGNFWIDNCMLGVFAIENVEVMVVEPMSSTKATSKSSTVFTTKAATPTPAPTIVASSSSYLGFLATKTSVTFAAPKTVKTSSSNPASATKTLVTSVTSSTKSNSHTLTVKTSSTVSLNLTTAQATTTPGYNSGNGTWSPTTDIPGADKMHMYALIGVSGCALLLLALGVFAIVTVKKRRKISKSLESNELGSTDTKIMSSIDTVASQ